MMNLLICIGINHDKRQKNRNLAERKSGFKRGKQETKNRNRDINKKIKQCRRKIYKADRWIRAEIQGYTESMDNIWKYRRHI